MKNHLHTFAKIYTRSFVHFLLKAIKIQLILCLCSLPILVYWGLRISFLALVGNVLFAPFITAYLFCALIWYLIALCHFSTAIPALLLEYLTTLWLKLLSLASPSCMFTLPCPPSYIIGLIPLSTTILIVTCSCLSLTRQIFLYTLLLVSWISLLKLAAQKSTISVQQHKKSVLYLVPYQKRVFLIDYAGTLRSSSFQESWVTFTLKPMLAKHYGVTHCAAIVLVKPSIRRLEAACQIINLGVAPLIQIPLWAYKQPWFNRWKQSHSSITVEIFENQSLLTSLL